MSLAREQLRRQAEGRLSDLDNTSRVVSVLASDVHL